MKNGESLSLSLDKFGGSSIQSKNEFLFGKFDMQIKLVPGNSAGTVTSFYLSSLGLAHDEIDFEFLGNLSGDPYVLHTNVFTHGGGGREQQFYLSFDPTADFHTYSILWTSKRILFSVDGTPIREFKNLESIGVPYANNQSMRIYASIWNAEYWATQGGRVRTNWTEAPFTATYQNFQIEACVWSSGKSSCNPNSKLPSLLERDADDLDDEDDWLEEESDFIINEGVKWAQEKYMIYNYCSDLKKYPRGLPAECVYKTWKKGNTLSS